ncbi:4-(cytidine 5'-diphospho)-2-C-methyl-D-erythritol kinase [Aurantivibrio infirmus]
MSELILPAPAKINLFLHILGRRPDGYHRLQTIFQLLDFGDELRFELRQGGQISFSANIEDLSHNDNLVCQAARALQQECGSKLGARIYLDKHLPFGGGLGGGSSDAATTLLALNELWQCGLNIDQLAKIGLSLGADVPIFVRGQSAWAEGIGETLTAMDLPCPWFVVLSPPVMVSTALVFSHPELTRDTPPITVAASFEQGTRNDCEPLVTRLFPEVGEALKWLQRHPLNTAKTALMSGSGASVFASFDSETIAQQVLADSPWRGFVAKGVNQSPVHQLLAKFIGV